MKKILACVCLCVFVHILFCFKKTMTWRQIGQAFVEAKGSDPQPARKKPNILFIMSDDMGLDDVPWNNPFVDAPNLQNLAKEGRILSNFYSQSLCGPSRAATLTGLYPIHLGLQAFNLETSQPYGIPTRFKLMPEYFNRLGYTSHAIGKWHVGYCNSSYLPNSRGFSSFHGYRISHQDYYAHTMVDTEFYDFWKDDKPDYSARGTYSTFLFEQYAIDTILDHARTQDNPFFIYLAFETAHAPLQVPDQFHSKATKDSKRKKYLGMVSAMDYSIGNILMALEESGQRDNTVIVFMSDNGAAPGCGGSNFPLRGGKGSLWEGGHKMPAFVNAPGYHIRDKGTPWNGLMHTVDWLPTIFQGILGQADPSVKLDGVNQWDSILANADSNRDEIVYNINPIFGKKYTKSSAIRVGNMKLIRGQPSILFDNIVVPAERLDHPPQYRTTTIGVNRTRKNEIRLYDLAADPSEEHDLSSSNLEAMQHLLERLEHHEKTMVPPAFTRIKGCKDGAPVKFGGLLETGWCAAKY